jgi:cysteine synthase A
VIPNCFRTDAPPRSNNIENVGAGFDVPFWKPAIVGEIAKTSTADAVAMARRLAKGGVGLCGDIHGGQSHCGVREGERIGSGAYGCHDYGGYRDEVFEH